MEKRKVEISIRRLKVYLDEVGIKVVKLAELSDINPQHLSKALCGTPDNKTGKPTSLTLDDLHNLEFGMEQLSYELGNIFIVYDTDREIVKRSGNRYCPACVEQIKEKIRPYMSLLPFIQKTLGWNYSKVRNVLDKKDSPSSGNISRDDCDRINIRMAEIAACLGSFSFV